MSSSRGLARAGVARLICFGIPRDSFGVDGLGRAVARDVELAGILLQWRIGPLLGGLSVDCGVSVVFVYVVGVESIGFVC